MLVTDEDREQLAKDMVTQLPIGLLLQYAKDHLVLMYRTNQDNYQNHSEMIAFLQSQHEDIH